MISILLLKSTPKSGFRGHARNILSGQQIEKFTSLATRSHTLRSPQLILQWLAEDASTQEQCDMFDEHLDSEQKLATSTGSKAHHVRCTIRYPQPF